MSWPRSEPKLPRSLHFALFVIGLLWLLAARIGAESAAEGISRLVRLDLIRPLLREAFLLILLPTGFTALNWVGTRNGGIRATNALPTRATAGREWQKGAALGWAMLVVAVLPMALAGGLHPEFWFAPRAWGLALLSLITIALGSLAVEIAFRGFLFQRLISATGPGAAAVLLSGVYALVSTSLVNTTPYSFVVSLMIGFLFSLAYLRTHALWVGWGLRFGWIASMAVLFGLPVGGSAELANVVATNSSGRIWLTGGPYGPEGALLTVFVVLAGMFALYSLTRDYAWQYTHAPIVPGGYPMEVAPPAAHAAMEAAAAAPALVQITPVISAGAPPVLERVQPVPSSETRVEYPNPVARPGTEPEVGAEREPAAPEPFD